MVRDSKVAVYECIESQLVSWLSVRRSGNFALSFIGGRTNQIAYTLIINSILPSVMCSRYSRMLTVSVWSILQHTGIFLKHLLSLSEELSSVKTRRSSPNRLPAIPFFSIYVHWSIEKSPPCRKCSFWTNCCSVGSELNFSFIVKCSFTILKSFWSGRNVSDLIYLALDFWRTEKR